MKLRILCVVLCVSLPLWQGCQTGGASNSAALASIEQDGETLLIHFPSCFVVDHLRVNQQGKIPCTPLAGSEMTSTLTLDEVSRQFRSVLNQGSWTIRREEAGGQSFRIVAQHLSETVEIRAVQGTSGPTEIFLLYAAVEGVIKY